MRDLTTAFKNELVASSIRPIFLYKGIFDIQTLYLNTGLIDITYNTEDYIGNGWFNNISTIQESTDIISNGFAIEITGMPQIFLSNILNNKGRNNAGYVWLGLLDSDNDLIISPSLIASGFFSHVNISKSSNNSSVSINYESKLSILTEAPSHRYTHEGQKAFYPEDKGFEYVSYLQEWRGFWGLPSSDT